MQSAIQKLFIKINEDIEMGAEYKEAISQFSTAHKKFLQSLDGEQREAAEEVFDLNEKYNYESAYDYFKAGLKLGLMLGMEVNGDK